jgi:hypothetical protein
MTDTPKIDDGGRVTGQCSTCLYITKGWRDDRYCYHYKGQPEFLGKRDCFNFVSEKAHAKVRRIGGGK